MRYRKTRLTVLLSAAVFTWTLAPRASQAQIEFGLPTVPQASPDAFNVEGGYGYPWFPADGLSMYFGSDRPGPNVGEAYSPGQFDIWTTRRASVNDPWEEFVNLGEPVNTADKAEFAASLTADGQQLYFMRSLSPFGLPEGDLYVSLRQEDDTWAEPQQIAELNTSDGIEAYPTISPDGNKLYFNTLANPNYESPTGLNWNMWVAERSSTTEPFGEPEFFFGGYGTVTPDGLTHVMFGYPDFADYYDVPNLGDGDLYIRTRASVDDPFGPVEHLPAPVNSSGQLLPPPLTGVGLECCATFTVSDNSLYFASVRPGTDSSGPLGFIDMWQAPLAEAVSVDVKPGSALAPINLKSKGVLPVAILSTADFDVSQIDPATLKFGDPLLIADGAMPVDPLRWSYEDIDFDGLNDLALKFSLSDLLDNQVFSSATTEGYLAGQLFDGSHIAGRDAVRIVGGAKAIPEPSSLLLLVFGLSALALCKK